MKAIWKNELEDHVVVTDPGAVAPEGFTLCYLESGCPINIPTENIHPLPEDDPTYGVGWPE